MNTTEINATRLTTIRGPVATELVTASRNHLRQKARLVAIGRSVAGSGFVVTTGGDPVVDRWQAEGAPTCGATWSGDYSGVVPAEQRDGYIGD